MKISLKLRPSRLLAPLVPVYAGVVALQDLAYSWGWKRQHHLRAPVISVGNLSVGGTGKTPFVICLAQLLAGRGYAVDVLSRGYGRHSAATERVDPASEDAGRYGDEPLLIAQKTGVPVYVGGSRYAAGLLAEADAERSSAGWTGGEEQGRAAVSAAVPGLRMAPGTAGAEAHAARVHLLDDGFQHRRLARSVDIVLLGPSDAAEWLLPAGRLREPLAALRRAQVVVLAEEDTLSEATLRRHGLTLPIWRVTRELVLPEELLVRRQHTAGGSGGDVPVRAVAFCGIAQPQGFFSGLVQAGCPLMATYAFADHHEFSRGEIETLAAHANQAGATHLLTTEKDWVRLPAWARSRLAKVATVRAIPLRMRLMDEEHALEELARLAARRRG